jgi:hypothetical protein
MHLTVLFLEGDGVHETYPHRAVSERWFVNQFLELCLNRKAIAAPPQADLNSSALKRAFLCPLRQPSAPVALSH